MIIPDEKGTAEHAAPLPGTPPCFTGRYCRVVAEGGLPQCSLLVRGLVLGEGDATDRALQKAKGLNDGTVVHLVVRRTAKVNYSVQGSNFELSISASDTADTVKRCAFICGLQTWFQN